MTGHWVISAENFRESAAIATAATTTTPGSWPSTPFAPILSIFIIKTVQPNAKISARIQILLSSPNIIKEICGCDRSIIPPPGRETKAIPIPAAIGTAAAMKPNDSLR